MRRSLIALLCIGFASTALAQTGTSFSTTQPDGVAVFMPVLSSAGTSVVRVFVPDYSI